MMLAALQKSRGDVSSSGPAAPAPMPAEKADPLERINEICEKLDKILQLLGNAPEAEDAEKEKPNDDGY